MKWRLPVIAFAGLLLAADAPPDPAKEALTKLEGTWTTTSLHYNGKDITKKYPLKFIFKGDLATIEGTNAVKKEYAKIAFKLDPSTTPACVDMTIAGGTQKDAVIEGIYELKADELKICAKVVGKDRPGEFASPEGSSIVLLVLKRENPR
jgi:uncharacterized protein (TIGR03067 family)